MNRGLQSRLGLAALVAMALALSQAVSLRPGEAQGLGKACSRQETFALAVHGGVVWGAARHARKEAFIGDQLRVGGEALASGRKALDVVANIVAAMEDSGLFNAGKGSIANRAGEIEMDASIMEGRHLGAGAVAAVAKLKNPIAAARSVMDDTPQVMMIGPAAEKRLLEIGAEAVGPDYFLHSGQSFPDLTLPEDLKLVAADPGLPAAISRFAGVWAGVLDGKLNHVLVVERLGSDGGDVVVAVGADEGLGIPEAITLRAPAKFMNQFLIVETQVFRIAYRATEGGELEARLAVKDGGQVSGRLRSRPELLGRSGTVGAVALDRCGDLAAATSTGGFGSKPPGRVGDSPIIGAGTYADNRSAAVSASGHGEAFIRHAVAHEIAARLRHGGQSLAQAAHQVVFEELEPGGGRGGVIAIDKAGAVVMLYNTDGMVRGSTTNRLSPNVATYATD